MRSGPGSARPWITLGGRDAADRVRQLRAGPLGRALPDRRHHGLDGGRGDRRARPPLPPPPPHSGEELLRAVRSGSAFSPAPTGPEPSRSAATSRPSPGDLNGEVWGQVIDGRARKRSGSDRGWPRRSRGNTRSIRRPARSSFTWARRGCSASPATSRMSWREASAREWTRRSLAIRAYTRRRGARLRLTGSGESAEDVQAKMRGPKCLDGARPAFASSRDGDRGPRRGGRPRCLEFGGISPCTASGRSRYRFGWSRGILMRATGVTTLPSEGLRRQARSRSPVSVRRR